MHNFFRSLLLTTLLSFAAPIILLVGILAPLFAVSYVPGLNLVTQIGATEILKFLAVFGSGSPVQGILTIAFTWGIVGCLFDIFNFYRYQNLGVVTPGNNQILDRR